MKDFKKFEVTPLSTKEILEANGGESGWYYLAKAAKAVYLVIEAGMTVPHTDGTGLAGSRPFE